MKIMTVLGARPQFVKAAVVSAAFRRAGRGGSESTSSELQAAAGGSIEEVLVHTGQHYDHNMSQSFFQELDIPEPKHNLAVGSGTHGVMTGRMMVALEPIVLEEKPDWVLVYGDTNSTLAGALVASKLHIPVCHVEAGLRSFERRMPEEVNRVLTDHLSTELMCPTHAAVENLRSEGITRGVHHVGDVMFDAARVFAERAAASSQVLARLGLEPWSYFLCTVHRAENTDDPARLTAIVQALAELAQPTCPVVLPLHPRTRKILETTGIGARFVNGSHVRLVEPVGFLDMLLLEKHARLILTDSGGVQKEAYFHGVPCVTLRNETEWVETVSSGWNRLAGADAAAIVAAVAASRPGCVIDEYGDGHAADQIVRLLLSSSL